LQPYSISCTLIEIRSSGDNQEKTGGIIANILTNFLCGLPGLALACISLLATVGTQMPEVMV
jgi:hypothetical protein